MKVQMCSTPLEMFVVIESWLHQFYQYNAISLMTIASLIVITSPFYVLCDKSNRAFHTVHDNLTMTGKIEAAAILI